MTNIFDENQDIKSAKSITMKLREIYLGELADPSIDINIPGERQRLTYLATNWPGDEFVRQLVFDVSKIMVTHNVDPKEIKW